jgi:ribonucleoside-diphosphate reductase alpha chain
VVRKRYLARDDQGHPTETPAGMFRRVARNVAAADAQLPFEGRRDPARSEATFYRMMASLEFLPNSPTLMNAGRELQQLCACFVLPVDDSMEGIFDALKHTAVAAARASHSRACARATPGCAPHRASPAGRFPS